MTKTPLEANAAPDAAMDATMKEFWVASGHQLCRRDADGRLLVTDELIAAWLARPELAPPPEACAAERALHARLFAAPRAAVTAAELAALADADARENWGFFLKFRDLLLAQRSVEAAYLTLIAGPVDLPPLFVDQLAHLVLRNALEGCDDPFTLRAGELFFRSQAASLVDGALMLADAEIAEGAASPLQAMFGKSQAPDLDVMTQETVWTYFSRSDAHSMVLPLGAEPRARDGLARAVERWVGHLTGLSVEATPTRAFAASDWRWYVGLDAVGSQLGDAAWAGRPFDPARVAALFELRVAPDERLDADKIAAPIPLILGLGAAMSIRMKPQNLIMGLPWRGDAAQAARDCVRGRNERG
jgi:hypothetical protein